MGIAVVDIQNDAAYGFLHQLERMNVLRIVSEQRKPNNNGQKLSKRFAGALSSERVDELQKELNQMRNECDRNI